jgi:L-malate glycosyltransferase
MGTQYLKIGIVCYPTYGGSGVVATELGKALADKGHCIHFITYKEPARLTTYHQNIRYHEVSFENYSLFEFPPYETALASRMVDIVKKEKLDILHVHYAIPHASAAYLAKQILKGEGIEIKVITTLHGTDITLVGKDPSFNPVVAFSIEQSDAVTAVSNSLREDTYRFFKINKQIEVIYNFIDFNKFSKKKNDDFRAQIAPLTDKILIHTSNFRKVKRIDDVVKVFAKVQETIPSTLLLIGDGPERNHIEDLVYALGINDKVKFLGKQDAVEDLLSIADLFLMPSQTESFGLAALEAMACEVPVVSSNAGGIPEINIDGDTGYLCAVGDVDAMALKTISILENEETLNRFKANALTQAKRFKLEQILPQYEELYKGLVRG